MSREFEFTDKDFKFIAQFVYDRVGIVLAEHKRDMVYARLARRLRALRMRSFTEYISYIQSNEGFDEIGDLVNAITTNLTSFFRESHHFDYLRDELLEPIMSGKMHHPNPKIRIWSAGCSSGAEPYSIAMVVADLMDKYKGWDIKILATDIDTNMLARGRKGRYRDADADSIPPRYKKFMREAERPGDEGIVMNDKLRDLITFNQLNLMDTRYPMKGKFDVIFCRNVVIYFDKPTQTKLFSRYADYMLPNGWLFVGHSENLFKVTDRFELEGKTIYRRVK